jgi:hypothetical protein
MQYVGWDSAGRPKSGARTDALRACIVDRCR